MVNRTVECCGALIFSIRTRRYLFLLRDHSTYSGTWGLAGGKIEANETCLVTLEREIKEELGCDLVTKKILPLEKFTSDNQQFIYHTYFIAVDNEFMPTLNHEHKGYAWVAIEDHPKPLHPGVWRTFNFAVVLEKIKRVESILIDNLLDVSTQ